MYLATQLREIGIPLIAALNMMDVVEKNKDFIDADKLSEILQCKVVEISALKNRNIDELITEAKSIAGKQNNEIKTFTDDIETALQEIENFSQIKDLSSKRWLAIKLFEDDEKVVKAYKLNDQEKNRLEEIRTSLEEKYDDDAEGIITDARY